MNRIIRIAALTLTLAPAALKAETASPRAIDLPSDTLHACYVPGSGSVYRIMADGAPDACVKSKHVEFSWESVPSSGRLLDVSWYESATFQLVGPGDVKMAGMSCSAPNQFVISGGFNTTGGGNGVLVQQNGPKATAPGERPTTWSVRLESDPHVLDNHSFSFSVYVVCGKISP